MVESWQNYMKIADSRHLLRLATFIACSMKKVGSFYANKGISVLLHPISGCVQDMEKK